MAGYGTGARLEYLLVPLVFGLGAPLVALVGTNIGAGQRQRALQVALIGGAVAFGLTEAVGLAAAFWPHAWLDLFGHDPRMVATGTAYLRSVGPTYGFFGLGLALYFASQGAGRLLWPLLAGILRMLIAVGGGWLALSADRRSWLGVRRAEHRPGGVWRDAVCRDRRAGSGSAAEAGVPALAPGRTARAALACAPATDLGIDPGATAGTSEPVAAWLASRRRAVPHQPVLPTRNSGPAM